MNIQITARHDRKVSDETRDFIEGEIEALTKFYDKITSAQVVWEQENLKSGTQDTVKLLLNIDGGQVVGTASSENMGKAFDGAIQKVVEQLKKQNELKKKSHHSSKPLSEVMEEKVVVSE
ncbi:MAG: ribosome-associated translation inhibitor RaiA [Chitinivibrionia bacterium]|jgi:ribosomal subunit interface protein|nr:ribosome-associated translation inhibitor RaiA [Chitinivibrionia bacterium]